MKVAFRVIDWNLDRRSPELVAAYERALANRRQAQQDERQEAEFHDAAAHRQFTDHVLPSLLTPQWD